MIEFLNPIDPARFERTNALWNELRLNDPWSVGYVTTLIEMETFPGKEAWEDFYYQSGAERLTYLRRLPLNLARLLRDEQLVRRNQAAVVGLPEAHRVLNQQFGRTPAELANKGRILYEEAVRRNLGVTQDECEEAVRFRTICQTWNGVVLRERQAVACLLEQAPSTLR